MPEDNIMLALKILGGASLIGFLIYQEYNKKIKNPKYSYPNAPIIATLINHVKKKEFQEVELQLLKLTPNNQTVAIESIAKGIGRKVINDWLEISSNSKIAELIAGIIKIQEAWEARTLNLARDVSMEQFQIFHNKLETAQTHLLSVPNDSPFFMEASANLIAVGRGLSDIELVESSFNNCISKDKNHFLAQTSYLQSIMPKWLGTKEKVDDYMENKRPTGTLIQLKTSLEKQLDDLGFSIEEENNNGLDFETEKKKSLDLLISTDKKINNISKEDLQIYKVYQSMYYLADFCEERNLEIKYKDLIKPIGLFL